MSGEEFPELIGGPAIVLLEAEECVVKANPDGDIVCYRDHRPGPDGHYFLTRENRQSLMNRGKT